MSESKLRRLPENKPLILKNKTCVYCGNQLTPETRSKEHVIGRRFVPRGKLDQQWNLIVRACKNCNRVKAKLEDEVSAITMQPDALGRHVVADELLVSESERKAAGSISGITGKPIKDSSGKISIKGRFGPGEITVTMVSPPQIDPFDLYRLACMQNMAFFYLITYNQKRKRSLSAVFHSSSLSGKRGMVRILVPAM